MKNLFYKKGSIFTLILLLLSVLIGVSKAQKGNFKALELHEEFSRVNPAINFAGLYAYSKKDTVNQKIFEPGTLGSGFECHYVIYHNTRSTQSYRYKECRDKLYGESRKEPYVPIDPDTLHDDFPRFNPKKITDKVVIGGERDKRMQKNAAKKLTGLKNNFRIKEEHIVNLEEHIVNLKEHRSEIEDDKRNRTNSSILRRAIKNWPEIKRYVEEKGSKNIRVIDSRRNRSNFSIENAIIEIAIPGRQFGRDFSQRISERYSINLPEFESIGKHSSIGSRQYRESWDRTKIQASTRNGTRTRGQQSSDRSRTHGERIERN